MAGAGDVAEDRSSTVINFTRNQFSSFFFFTDLSVVLYAIVCLL